MLPEFGTVQEELATFLAILAGKDGDVLLCDISGIGAPVALDQIVAFNTMSDLTGSDAFDHVFGVSDLGRCASECG